MYLTLQLCVQVLVQRKGFPSQCFLALQGVKQVTAVTPARPLAVLQPEVRLYLCLVPAEPQQNSYHALSCCIHLDAVCGYPNFKWGISNFKW